MRIDKDGNITALRRSYDLKRRESKELPPERLRQILSRIYPEHIVDELMHKLIDTPNRERR
jgi:hypothetical protein